MTSLAQHNNLITFSSGVLGAEPKQGGSSYSYSDGDDQENYIRETILKASDRSSLSEELEQQAIDWASEYHFTSKRANLLRELDFGSAQSALEFGCGCGSITRYLAETGLQLDSIEGSLRRAEIARLRCEGLDNVNIINKNYNDLLLPPDHYDAVFFIGVLEYSKRFHASASSDREALIEILSNTKKTLKQNGVVVIAIENRVGLKYLMGATEDHYAIPNIGLYDYPDSTGMRTYDIEEWKSMLEESGFAAHRFAYPFPDYKLTSTILSDNFLREDEFAYSVLYNVVSRDYIRKLETDVDEFLFWRTLHKVREIEKFANSFMIVASDSSERVDQLIPFDFVRFSNPDRRKEFRTVTTKKQGQSRVSKKSLFDRQNQSNTIVHIVEDEPYRRGRLLVEQWCEDINIYCNLDRFDVLVKKYYEFLIDYDLSYGDQKDIFDILPSNIIVDENGAYGVIDKEWVLDKKLAPEYILFRGLFYFFTINNQIARNLFRKYRFQTLREFIPQRFEKLNLELSPQVMEEYVALENSIQNESHAYRDAENISRSLDANVKNTLFGLEYYPTVYWASEGEPYSELNSVSTSVPFCTEKVTAKIRLPESATNVQSLRFDPADEEGFFHIYSLHIHVEDHQQQKVEIILDCKSGKEVAENSTLVGLSYGSNQYGDLFITRTSDPQIIFKIPSGIKVPKGGAIVLEITLDWSMSQDYLIAYDGFLIRENRLIEELNQLKAQVKQLEQVAFEFDLVKKSRSWAMVEKIRAGVSRLRSIGSGKF